MKYPIFIDTDGEGGFFKTSPDGTRVHYPAPDYAARVHRTANAIMEAMNYAPWFDYEAIAKGVIEYEDKQEYRTYSK